MNTTSVTVRQHGTHAGTRISGLHRWGAWAATHPVLVIGVWVVLLVGAVVSSGYFTSHLTGNNNRVAGSDSGLAAAAIERAFPAAADETDFVVLHSGSRTADDPEFRAVVTAAVSAYRGQPRVQGVTSPYDLPQLVSPDRRTALVAVNLSGDQKQLQDAAPGFADLAAGLRAEGIEVDFTGSAPLMSALNEKGAEDLALAESVGFPAAAIVLLLAFGSVVAAAIPLALGVLGVVFALGVLGVVSLFMSFDVFVQTAVSMVGIALGIDYTLFLVTRFREELAAVPGDGPDRTGRAVSRDDRIQAVGRTVATAGHAILFSGTTVVVSITGLWLVRSDRVRSMAMGMTAAVLVMMLLSITLLPALLGLLGHRVNRLALPWARASLAHPDPSRSVWARLATRVMRRPVVIAVVATAALGALSVPVFGLKLGIDLGTGALDGSSAGKGLTAMTQGFPPGILTPVTVVAANPSGRLDDAQLAAVASFSSQASAHADVANVISVTDLLDQGVKAHTQAALTTALSASPAALTGVVDGGGSTTVVTVAPRAAADTGTSAALVADLRDLAARTLTPSGLTAHVGGTPAELADLQHESSRALPLVIGTVLLVSWFLLLWAFRSVLLPVKAILMNLLTCGAAFGATVLIFQKGYGAGLLGVERVEFVQALLPLLAFAIVFGLSMDYEVFMISRMREEWDKGGDNEEAVRLGLVHTARVITAAASIMIVVFASFMLTSIVEIKQMGFMFAFAVLIDATVVRLFLVPSLMRLMGSWAWWLPGRRPRPATRPH